MRTASAWRCFRSSQGCGPIEAPARCRRRTSTRRVSAAPKAAAPLKHGVDTRDERVCIKFPQLPRLRPQLTGPVRYTYDRLAVDTLPLMQRITARAGAPMAETDSLLKRLVSTCIL